MSSIDNSASTMKVDRSRLVRLGAFAGSLLARRNDAAVHLRRYDEPGNRNRRPSAARSGRCPSRSISELHLDVLNGGFWVYLRNSVFVLVLSDYLILVISSMAAYAPSPACVSA